jgi:hypothetical protein
MVESVRWRRLRWRLRGAWQWPAFVVLTVADAVIVARLPRESDVEVDAYRTAYGLFLRGAQLARGEATSKLVEDE